MILIGQYDSSFTRRVGIALRLYGMPFEHRPWSVFGDADRLMDLNPLGRVPVLVLDDGTALVDSHMILDHLDSLVAPADRLFPIAEPARHVALRRAALATGLGDRVVSLFYERRLHDNVSPTLDARLSRQIAATLSVQEQDRAAEPRDWWHGSTPGHADIALACVLRHLRESLPDAFDPTTHPALAAHCARAEALPVFIEISQPFVAPT
jgi:glutathione S-transferase